jgi:hypothetical protein
MSKIQENQLGYAALVTRTKCFLCCDYNMTLYRGPITAFHGNTQYPVLGVPTEGVLVLILSKHLRIVTFSLREVLVCPTGPLLKIVIF